MECIIQRERRKPHTHILACRPVASPDISILGGGTGVAQHLIRGTMFMNSVLGEGCEGRGINF